MRMILCEAKRMTLQQAHNGKGHPISIARARFKGHLIIIAREVRCKIMLAKCITETSWVQRFGGVFLRMMSTPHLGLISTSARWRIPPLAGRALRVRKSLVWFARGSLRITRSKQHKTSPKHQISTCTTPKGVLVEMGSAYAVGKRNGLNTPRVWVKGMTPIPTTNVAFAGHLPEDHRGSMSQISTKPVITTQ